MITRLQVKMAFAGLEWTLDDAARELMIDRSTLFRLTSDDNNFAKSRKMTKTRIERGLVDHGVEFASGGWVRRKSSS